MTDTQTPAATDQTHPANTAGQVVTATGNDPTPTPTVQRDAATDEPLRPEGLRALEQEREARKRLEGEVAPLREQMDALRRAFGAEATPGKPEDIVTHLQQQVEQMQRDSLVNTVARRHGITNDDDVALLRGATDADHMARLAERLKAPAGPVIPAPDPQASADAEYNAFFQTH